MANWTEDTLSDSQRDWLEAIRSCEASGQSMKAYAEANGLSLPNFYAWKKTFVQKGMLPRTRSSRLQQASRILNPYDTAAFAISRR